MVTVTHAVIDSCIRGNLRREGPMSSGDLALCVRLDIDVSESETLKRIEWMLSHGELERDGEDLVLALEET